MSNMTGRFILVTLVIFYLGLMIFCAISSQKNPECTQSKLKAISLNSELTGSFFLGIGGFGEDIKYQAFVEEDGGYKLKSYYPNYVVIHENAITSPYVEKCSSSGNHHFYIPPNSIREVYELDLQNIK